MREERFIIDGSDGEAIQLKYLIPEKIKHPHPILIAHGFKGFMDWGHFPYVAELMAERGHFVASINYSHNGTSIDNPSDFDRLDLFAKNTYSKELYDINKAIDELEKSKVLKESKVDGSRVNLIGHSRGGGMVVVQAAEDKRVHKLVTWAAINSAGSFWAKDEKLVQEWKERGHFMIPNARTGQDMPLNYSLYEDSIIHADRLDILSAAQKINIPWLIIHGEDDPTIPVSVAHQFKEMQPQAELYIIPKAHHNFGGKHPLDENADFEQINKLAEETIRFIEN